MPAVPPPVPVEAAAQPCTVCDDDIPLVSVLPWNDGAECDAIAAVVLAALLRRPEFGGVLGAPADASPPVSWQAPLVNRDLSSDSSASKVQAAVPSVAELVQADEDAIRKRFAAVANLPSTAKVVSSASTSGRRPGDGAAAGKAGGVAKAAAPVTLSLEHEWRRAGGTTQAMVELLRRHTPGKLKTAVGQAVWFHWGLDVAVLKSGRYVDYCVA